MPLTDLVLTPVPSAIAVVVDDEAVVVDESTGALHLLNPQAALLWACLDGVSPLSEICVDLAEGLGVDVAVVSSDVAALADQLLDQGLVTAPGEDRRMVPVPAVEPCCCHAENPDHVHDERLLAELQNL